MRYARRRIGNLGSYQSDLAPEEMEPVNKARLLLSCLLLAALLTGCSTPKAPDVSVPKGAQAGDLSGLTPCEFRPADGNAKLPADCGTLVVPEKWDLPGSRLIALPVVRVPATTANP